MALVLDGPRPLAWHARVAEGVHATPALALGDVRLRPAPRRAGERLRRAQRRLEQRVFGTGADPFAPARAFAPRAGPAPPDMVLWLCDEPPGEADLAPLGVPVLWLSHSRTGEPTSAALRRAVHRREPVVLSEVRGWLPGRPGSSVLASSVAGVRPFSLWLTERALMWKCAELVVRAAVANGALPGAEPAVLAAHAPPHPAASFAASGVRMLSAVGRRALFRRPWEIRVRARPTRGAADPGWRGAPDLVAWRTHHVYADPILVEHEGRHHLFCEEVMPGRARGVISHVELRAGGDPGTPHPILERPYHLAYPFVFAHGEDLFMIPDGSAGRRVELLRAVDFPHAWSTEAVLMEDVDAADATVVEHEGRLWMFVARAAPGASLLDEVHLLWADAPAGPWTPHPGNPVVSDIRHGRPAGPLLRDGGRLVRPAQDGSRRYGAAIAFREVTLMTPTQYAERDAGRLAAQDVHRARAVHTYARDSAFEAIDVRRRELRLRRVAWRLAGLR